MSDQSTKRLERQCYHLLHTKPSQRLDLHWFLAASKVSLLAQDPQEPGILNVDLYIVMGHHTGTQQVWLVHDMNALLEPVLQAQAVTGVRHGGRSWPRCVVCYEVLEVTAPANPTLPKAIERPGVGGRLTPLKWLASLCKEN